MADTDDTLAGTGWFNRLDGAGGDDTISGGACHDYILGGSGDGIILGGGYEASSEGLCAGLRLRDALGVAHGAGESISRSPAGKNVPSGPTRRQADFDEIQATETVSW